MPLDEIQTMELEKNYLNIHKQSHIHNVSCPRSFCEYISSRFYVAYRSPMSPIEIKQN